MSGLTVTGAQDIERQREQQEQEQQARSEMLSTGLLDPQAAFRGRTGATELLGDLSRVQWDDYKKRFLPILDELIASATDAGAPEAAAERAISTTADRFNSAEKSMGLNDSRYGLQIDQDQMDQRQKRLALAGASSAVDSANKARLGVRDRQLEIMSGSQAAQLSQIDKGVR